MATVLGARGWDCGDVIITDADKSAGVTVSSDEAHTGAYSLGMARSSTGSSYSYANFAVSGTPTNPSVSIWIYLKTGYGTTATATSGTCLRFLLSTGEYVELRWNGVTHTFDAYVDNGLVDSGSVEVSMNTWFHTQFYLTVADPAGTIDVKIDGHTSITYVGDTDPTGGATVSVFRLHGGVGGTSNKDHYDDLVWGTGGYLGDLRCVEIRPNADTAQDDWTPSAGDNYSTIDETPPSDADYNETNTDAQADELAMGDFDGVTYDPRATVAWVRAKMLAATGDSINVGVDSNGTDSVTERALSTDEEYYFHTNDDNPDDSAAWEDADIDALLLRYESVIA